jgi:hypothetical protein
VDDGGVGHIPEDDPGHDQPESGHGRKKLCHADGYLLVKIARRFLCFHEHIDIAWQPNYQQLQKQYQTFMDHHKQWQDQYHALVDHHNLLEKLYETLMSHRYQLQDQNKVLDDYYQALQEHDQMGRDYLQTLQEHLQATHNLSHDSTIQGQI